MVGFFCSFFFFFHSLEKSFAYMLVILKSQIIVCKMKVMVTLSNSEMFIFFNFLYSSLLKRWSDGHHF